jgi:hypothetical protein
MKKNSFTKLLLTLVTSIFYLSTLAQDEKLIENETAVVNFDLRTAPTPNYGRQEISLMGCNTEVTSRDRYFLGDTNLKWGASNQIFKDVPYGWQTDEGRSYHVSKYYLASPPVMKTPYDGKQVNIGLVLPDHFSFFGDKPAQLVRLDYSVLEPVYLNFIPVEYETKEDSSCLKLGVNLIPLVIECQDFNWRSDGPTPAAKGASGIARIKNEDNQRQVFLPSYQYQDDYLNCNLTILDDIILKHDIWFKTSEGLQKSINMTQFYSNPVMKNTSILLHCKSRNVNPPGCQEKGGVMVIER